MTLFINCCPREASRTERLARALLKTLGEYKELRLYDEPLHPLGREDIARRGALLAEKRYDDEMFRYARQFAAADKIVIAAPLWDLSFPAQLKVYLENIYVTGIVTKYSDTGQPVGLCRASELSYVTTSAATDSAVRRLSPVIITILSMPSAWSACTAAFASLRSGSWMQMTAASSPAMQR